MTARDPASRSLGSQAPGSIDHRLASSLDRPRAISSLFAGNITTLSHSITELTSHLYQTLEELNQIKEHAMKRIVRTQLLTLTETARHLACSPRQVQYWARDPDCPLVVTQLDGRPRFSVQDIETFIARRRTRKRCLEPSSPSSDIPNPTTVPPPQDRSANGSPMPSTNHAPAHHASENGDGHSPESAKRRRRPSCAKPRSQNQRRSHP